MKRYIFILSLILISHCLCATSFEDVLGEKINGFSTVNNFNSVWDCYIFVLENQKLKFVDYDNQRIDSENWNTIYNYEIILKDPFYYLHVYSDSYDKIYLMLLSNYLILLYEKDSVQPYFIGEYNLERENGIREISNLNATSYLSEKNNQYLPTNLSILNLDSPWCEGVEGNGIGEKIFFPVENAKGISIINGYISYNKEYLYYQNSRVKSIKIEFENLNYSFIKKIDDNPNPQFIDFQKELKDIGQQKYSGTVIITIQDIYKGLKYQDTCINSIVIMNPIITTGIE